MAIAGSILARDDTLLGVCYGLAQDFGFNPIWLRILFACTSFWNPAAAIGGYAGLGALVAFSRWVAPDPSPARAQEAQVSANEDDREDLPLAA